MIFTEAGPKAGRLVLPNALNNYVISALAEIQVSILSGYTILPCAAPA